MDPDWLDEINLPDDSWNPVRANVLRQAVEQARALRPYGWRTVSPPLEMPIVMQRRRGLFRRRRIQFVLRTNWKGGGSSDHTFVSVEGIGWTVRSEQDLI